MLHRLPPRTAIGVLTAIAAFAASCTSEGAPAADPVAYRSALESLCSSSSTEQAALAPPGEIGVATFARSVGEILARQADDARALRPPADLDDDHRAFVQNTADQAGEWMNLASTSPDDTEEFGARQTAILELSLGRDDLSEAMQVPQCRVQQ